MSLRYMSRVGQGAGQGGRVGGLGQGERRGGSQEEGGGEAEARRAGAAHRHVPLRLGPQHLVLKMSVFCVVKICSRGVQM
jgi:hypothetical protein